MCYPGDESISVKDALMGSQPVNYMTEIGFRQFILACLVIVGASVLILPIDYAVAEGPDLTRSTSKAGLKDKYLQKEFLRLSQKKISELKRRYHSKRKKTRICEYSVNYSTYL